MDHLISSGFLQNQLFDKILNLQTQSSYKQSHPSQTYSVVNMLYWWPHSVQFSIPHCQIKEVLKIHTVGFQTTPILSSLIYRSKLQAQTRIDEHSFGTNFSNKCKGKQHAHIHLQRTEAPALHVQNRVL